MIKQAYQRHRYAISNHPGILVISGFSIVTSSLTYFTFVLYIDMHDIRLLSKEFQLTTFFCLIFFSLFSVEASITKQSKLICLPTIMTVSLTISQIMSHEPSMSRMQYHTSVPGHNGQALHLAANVQHDVDVAHHDQPRPGMETPPLNI